MQENASLQSIFFALLITFASFSYLWALVTDSEKFNDSVE